MGTAGKRIMGSPYPEIGPDVMGEILAPVRGVLLKAEPHRGQHHAVHPPYAGPREVHQGLETRLAQLPGSIFSGRKRPAKGARGVFFCYALPALDRESGEFTEEAGKQWAGR